MSIEGVKLNERGKGTLREQLDRLANVQTWYFAEGPGKGLSDNQSEFVKRQASWFVVGRGFSWKEREEENANGFSSFSIGELLKIHNEIGGVKFQGLERRANHLADIAKGFKKIPKGVEKI